jgi:hypothetical protein
VFSTLVGGGLDPEQRLRFVLWGTSQVTGRVVTLVGFAVSFFVFLFGLVRRRPAFVLLSMLPMAQALINVGADYLSSYSSNAYVLLLTCVAVAGQTLVASARNRHGRAVS